MCLKYGSYTSASIGGKMCQTEQIEGLRAKPDRLILCSHFFNSAVVLMGETCENCSQHQMCRVVFYLCRISALRHRGCKGKTRSGAFRRNCRQLATQECSDRQKGRSIAAFEQLVAIKRKRSHVSRDQT